MQCCTHGTKLQPNQILTCWPAILSAQLLFYPQIQRSWFKILCEDAPTLNKVTSLILHIYKCSFCSSTCDLKTKNRRAEESKLSRPWYASVFWWTKRDKCSGASRRLAPARGAAVELAWRIWRRPRDFVMSRFIGDLGEPLFALSVELFFVLINRIKL